MYRSLVAKSGVTHVFSFTPAESVDTPGHIKFAIQVLYHGGVLCVYMDLCVCSVDGQGQFAYKQTCLLRCVLVFVDH